MSYYLQVTKGFAMKIPTEDRELTLDDMQGMFLILGSGILIAILSLFLEYISHLINKHCYGKSKVDIIDCSHE